MKKKFLLLSFLLSVGLLDAGMKNARGHDESTQQFITAINGDVFARQRHALSASYKVLTVDLRGFGKSVAPDSTGTINGMPATCWR